MSSRDYRDRDMGVGWKGRTVSVRRASLTDVEDNGKEIEDKCRVEEVRPEVGVGRSLRLGRFQWEGGAVSSNVKTIRPWSREHVYRGGKSSCRFDWCVGQVSGLRSTEKDDGTP